MMKNKKIIKCPYCKKLSAHVINEGFDLDEFFQDCEDEFIRRSKYRKIKNRMNLIDCIGEIK